MIASGAMDSFKLVVDSLASVASLVAIVAVLVGWYRSARKPLKIAKVVVHRKSDGLTFILVTHNRQSYPVVVKRIDCYRRKIFEVTKKTGARPEYSELLSSREGIFMDGSKFEVPANAYTDLRVEVTGDVDVPPTLLFSLDTSHGYHELLCGDVTVVDMGKTELYSVEYKAEYARKWVAKCAYYWKVLVERTRRWSGRG